MQAASFAYTSTAFPMLTGTLVTRPASSRSALPGAEANTRTRCSGSSRSHCCCPGSPRWCSHPISGYYLLPWTKAHDRRTHDVDHMLDVPPPAPDHRNMREGALDDDRRDPGGICRCHYWLRLCAGANSFQAPTGSNCSLMSDWPRARRLMPRRPKWPGWKSSERRSQCGRLGSLYGRRFPPFLPYLR